MMLLFLDRTAKMLAALLLAMGVAAPAVAQERRLLYTITRGGSVVGQMTVREARAGNRVSLRLQSQVKTRFLVSIHVQVLEEAVYEAGVLTYGSYYQKVNGNERANIRMQASGTAYKVTTGAGTTWLTSYPVTYNLLCLYTMEPLQVRNLFLDKYQRFVPVKKTGPHQYQVTFPDGASNVYDYEGGTCVAIVLNSAWFNAEMHLKN